MLIGTDEAHEPKAPLRVAVVVSHPIQHFCPQYTSWAKRSEFELLVLFASRHGLDAYLDENFGVSVQWQELSLDFPHTFLDGATGRPIDRRIDGVDLDENLARFGPDVVVVYGYAQRLQRHAMAWARRNRRPLIMISDSELRSHRASWRTLVKRLVLPAVFAPISAFLTVGDANEEYYRRYGVDDARLVRSPFPIDTASFSRALSNRSELRAQLRDSWGVTSEQQVLLMVGKLVPWKRQIDLIAAARRIRHSRSDVIVVLAGTGPDEAQLRSAAAEGVIFAGFVQPKDLVAHYAASDVYVHCSEVEPHSLAISEAIFSGLPVILSDRCGSFGPSDDVRPGQNGFVYRCGDVAELSERIVQLVNDGSLRQRMGERSREIALHAQERAHGDGLVQALGLLARERRAYG